MNTKKLSREEVLYIANLSNLKLSEDEQDSLGEKLTETIDYIKVLEELDTSKVTETFQVTGLTNVFQKEEEKSETLTKEEALSSTGERIKDYFGTKAVFER